jgi:hypothetical protein
MTTYEQRDTQSRDTEQTRLSTADIARPAVRDEAPVEPQMADRALPRQDHEPLFAGQQASEFQQRWTDVQASFVDEPRRAVEQADMLVAEVMQRLAQAFADERKTLEQQWDRGDDTNTEELRQALRRYRSFFGRLLAL